MPRRIQIKKVDESSWYTFVINPSNFENLDNLPVNTHTTVDGQSVETMPVFDGRPRKMIWNFLPNRTPYKEFISKLYEYLNAGTVYIKLRDLTGTEGSDVSFQARVIDIKKEILGGVVSGDGHIAYKVTLTYVPISLAQ
jgi:hypothetical protein